MAQRIKRKTKKKTAKRSPLKRRTVKRKKPTIEAAPMSSRKKIEASNQLAEWVAYKELQDQVEKAWWHLKEAVRKNSNPKVLLRSRNELLLLLGECDYMARECMRIHGRQ